MDFSGNILSQLIFSTSQKC